MQVYRLITCGSVEEKIYRKQVFKGALSKSGTSAGVQMRYFSQQVSTLCPGGLVISAHVAGPHLGRHPGPNSEQNVQTGSCISKVGLSQHEATDTPA